MATTTANNTPATAAVAAAPAGTAAATAVATPSNPFASASLYVGDLAPEVNESMLYEIFNAVGPVASVRVCRDALTRRSLGYAYVNFHDVRDAERALDTMNFSNIHNRTCRIMWSQRDPTLRRSGAGNIYIKNLDPTIDSKTVYDTFSVFGNILSCKVVTNQVYESLGYGFVHFESEEAAKNAITTVNGKMLAGRVVAVQPFKSRKERESSAKKFTNVYVKGLPSDCNKQALEEHFGKYGTVTSCFLPMDEKNARPKGFGFINYETHEEAAAAIENLHDKDWNGTKLYVSKAQKKVDRLRELRSRFDQLRLEHRYAGVNLYIKNLTDSMNDQRLCDEFKKFGNITSARVMYDGNNVSRQFGFVCFQNSEEATKAVTEMNGKLIDGKPIYVALAQPKEVRRAALEARFNRSKMPFIQPGMYPQGPPFFFGPQMGRVVFPPNMPRQPMNRPWPPTAQGRGAPVMNVPFNNYMPNTRGGAAVRGRGQRIGKAPRPNPAVPPTAQARPPRTNLAFSQQARNKPQNMPANMPNAAPMAPTPQPLTIQELAQLPEQQQKKVIGDRLFPLIQAREPNEAPKITGMLLDMDNGELLHLLESQEALGEKIIEALQVLREAQHDEE